MFLHGYKTNMLHKERVHRKLLQTVVEFLQGGNIGTGVPFIFVCEQLCINRFRSSTSERGLTRLSKSFPNLKLFIC